MSQLISTTGLELLCEVHGSRSFVIPENLTKLQVKFVSKLIKSYFELKSIEQKNIILPKRSLSIKTRLHLVRHALRKYTLKDSEYRDSIDIKIVEDLILGFQL